MNDGWIALHRKIFSSKDFNNQLEVAIFIYLVCMASHKPTQIVYRKKKITLNRGEIAITFKDLSNKFQISERKARTIISNLKFTGNLNQTLTRNLSVYSIVKYSKYQDIPSKVNQTMTDRTTTITDILYSSNKDDMSLSSMTVKPKKISIPTLQDLKNKIIEKPKEKNEYQIMREKLDDEDYEKWVLSTLNS